MIRNNIKTFRESSGITQAELAQKLEVSHQSISSYEKGLREPSLDMIKKLADALNCKPTDLYPVLGG